jgi:hypothetical protein
MRLRRRGWVARRAVTGSREHHIGSRSGSGLRTTQPIHLMPAMAHKSRLSRRARLGKTQYWGACGDLAAAPSPYPFDTVAGKGDRLRTMPGVAILEGHGGRLRGDLTGG